MARPQRTDLDFNNQSRLLNLPPGSASGHAVEYDQFNNALEGLAWKDSARVKAQVNVTVASPGTTIDGITMVAGDRVLLGSQTSQPENGGYIWNGAAVPMTRSVDMSTAAELEQAIVTVEEGTSAGTSWRQTQVNFTLGSGNVIFTQFGTAAQQATETTSGIAEVATQAETDTGTDDLRMVTPLKLATWSGKSRKLDQQFGDGAATQYDIVHNFNTRALHVAVYRNSTPWDEWGCDVEKPDVNTVRLRFTSAPTLNQLRVTIMA